MARLASEEKAGYYPTPPAVVDLIAARMDARVPTDADSPVCRMIDPCCGEGDALSRLAQRFRNGTGRDTQTIGVELHEGRARAARGRLDAVWQGDTFAVETGERFDLLYLNPPYALRDLELKFLHKCTQFLADDGLLIYIVPRRTIERSARFLASNFHDFTIWEFPEGERESFGQVTLAATKNMGFAALSPGAEAELGEFARTGFGDPRYQFRDDLTDRVSAPCSEGECGRPALRMNARSPEAALMAARTRGIWNDPSLLLSMRPARESDDSRPLAPMTAGHLAQICASGLLNNLPLGDAIISGAAYKTKTQTEDENKVVITESVKLSVAALDLRTWETYDIT